MTSDNFKHVYHRYVIENFTVIQTTVRVYEKNKYTESAIKTYTIIIIIDTWKYWIMISNMTVSTLTDEFDS